MCLFLRVKTKLFLTDLFSKNIWVTIRISVRALVYCIVCKPKLFKVNSNFLKSEGGGPTGSQTRNYGLALTAYQQLARTKFINSERSLSSNFGSLV